MRVSHLPFLALAAFACDCAPKCDLTRCPDDLAHSKMAVSYYDGSANGYIFAQNTVEYIPVKREESSSLTYSGGLPFKRSIDEQTYRQIANAFNLAIAAKSIHISNRVMGSGVISVKCGDESRDWIIAPRSTELDNIESLLQDLRKANSDAARP